MRQERTALVTGASGHLGNVLVRALLRKGQTVRALLLPGDPALALEGLEVDRFEADLLDRDALTRATADIRTVYHVAGLISLNPADGERLMAVNAQGTRNLIAACRETGVQRLVYTSSVHALGEDLAFDPDTKASAYGRSKAHASLAVMEAAREGIEATVLCPTGIIGPHDYLPSQFGGMLSTYLAGKMPVGVRGGFDYVDVRDVAAAHLGAAEAPSGSAYVLSGEFCSMRRLFALLDDLTGKGEPYLLPWAAARPLASVLYALATLVGRRPAVHPAAMDVLREGTPYTSEPARRELGFAPRPLRGTLSDTLDWLRERPVAPN